MNITTKKNTFVDYLQSLKASGNRKAMAELRRGLSYDQGHYFQSYRHTESPEARGDDETDWGSRIRALIGGLFALHGDEGHRGENDNSLGRVLGALYFDKEKSPSIEKRFLTLLDSDDEQLPYRLRQIISLIKEYKIDWGKLHGDMRNWNHPDRYVQRRWAMDFYRAYPRRAENSEK